jgi:phosphoribosylamine--glycine ligase
VITGLENLKDVQVFFAGSKASHNNILTSGGRVLAVTGMSESLQDAINKTYKQMGKINFEKIYYRKDLGKDLLEYLD